MDVRIGGICALERIARDSARDHPTVIAVPSAFIHEHSREQWPPPDNPEYEFPLREIRPDVQARACLIGRRDPENDVRWSDLTVTPAVDRDLAVRRMCGGRGGDQMPWWLGLVPAFCSQAVMASCQDWR